VLEIRIAPLRERIEDLPELTAFLLAKLGEKNKKTFRSVSPAYLDILTRYAWPGNVRELENVLERSVILARSDTLTPETLPPHLIEAVARRLPQATLSEAPVSFEEAERLAVVTALEANEGHRERTAEALGISRRTLQYKLKKFGLAKR